MTLQGRSFHVSEGFGSPFLRDHLVGVWPVNKAKPNKAQNPVKR